MSLSRTLAALAPAASTSTCSTLARRVVVSRRAIARSFMTTSSSNSLASPRRAISRTDLRRASTAATSATDSKESEGGVEEEPTLEQVLETLRDRQPTPEEVKMVVEWVVERHVKLEGNEDVSKFKMTDLSVKFKIVKDCMEAFDRRIHSVDLTNMLTVADLTNYLSKEEPRDPLYGEDTVERMFREQAHLLPPNMSWVRKDRRELIAGTGTFGKD